MLDFNWLAKEKADHLNEDEGAWHDLIVRVYKSSAEQVMTDEEFTQLIVSVKNTKTLALIFREFFRFTKQDSQHRSAYRLLVQEVDESEFELEQWLEALAHMYSWLMTNRKQADFVTILGYLNCCAQSPVNQISRKRLEDLCVEFLEEYGFEKAK